MNFVAFIIDIDLDQWYSRIIMAAALVTAAAVLYAKVVRPVWNQTIGRVLAWFQSVEKRLGDMTSGLAVLIDNQKEIKKKVDFLEADSKYNGGSTTKDMVRNIAARTEAILELSDVPTYETTADGACIRANHRLCQLFGLGQKEMFGFGWMSAVTPADRERVNEAWQTAVAMECAYEDEYTVVNQVTHKPVKCRTMATPIKDPQTGEILLWQGKVRCVTKCEGVCACGRITDAA